MQRKISIAIPTFERVDWTLRAFEQILYDDRVGEVILSDDFSDIDHYARLMDCVEGVDKVKLFRNERNVDCYINKKIAIELSCNPWCILADSDNVFGVDYLDRIYEIQQWELDTIYAPVFAAPNFDYREFSGVTVTKENVTSFMDRPIFQTALNTCNFFVNRNEYLRVWKGDIDPITADSIYFVYCWLESGRKIFFVPNLAYDHTVHPLSHYKQNAHRSGHLHMQIEQQLRNLK